MCRITKLEPELNQFSIEMANSTASRPRNFAAASVPHLDWHCIPKAGNSVGRTHVASNGLKIDGRSIAEAIGISDNARRKAQPSVTFPSASVHSFDSIDAAKPSSAKPVDVTPLQRCFASGVGTVFMTLAMNPLDVVKVRLQAQHKFILDGTVCAKPPVKLKTRLSAKFFAGLNRTSNPRSARPEKGQALSETRLNGTIDGFRKIVRREGLRSLWSGLPPTLLMRIPANVVYFTVYDGLKTQLGFHATHPNDLHSILVTICSSGCARAMSITLVSPLDLVRTKLQSQRMTYQDLSHCIKSGFQAEGIFSLWRGLGPTILRDVPYAILYWTNYELLKGWIMKLADVKEASVPITFSAGTASGIFSSVVTTPFDVVKTNKQIAIGEAVKLDGSPCPTRMNTLKMIQQIRLKSGVSALFAGVGPRVAMSAPASAILITCYEFSMSLFKEYNASKSKYMAT